MVEEDCFEWICGKQNYRSSDAAYCGRLIVTNDLFDEALDWGVKKPERFAFRVTWALEHAFSYSPARLFDYCERITDNYLQANYFGVIRLYSKMMVRLLSAPKTDLSSDCVDRIVDVTFTRLIDSAIPPSVRVWCMDILCRLPHQESWIGEEISEVLKWFRQSHVPSLRSHAKMMCRKVGL